MLVARHRVRGGPCAAQDVVERVVEHLLQVSAQLRIQLVEHRGAALSFSTAVSTKGQRTDEEHRRVQQ